MGVSVILQNGCGIQGPDFLELYQGVKWQQGVTAGVGLCVYNVLDGPLYNIDWYSGVVVGREKR